MPALASASESSCDDCDSDWDLDALVGGSSSEGSADERVRSRSPAPRGVRSTRAVGRRMIAGTPAERRGWLTQRAAHGPDPSLNPQGKESDGNGDDGRVPCPEVDDDPDDGSIGDGSALGSEIDAGALADHDSDGFESDQDGSLRGEDADLEINGFAEDFGHTEHGVSADAEMAQAGAADGVAVGALDKVPSDAQEVARESRRSAFASATPAGEVTDTEAELAGGATADTDERMATGDEVAVAGALDGVAAQVTDQGLSDAETLARESQPPAAAAASRFDDSEGAEQDDGDDVPHVTPTDGFSAAINMEVQPGPSATGPGTPLESRPERKRSPGSAGGGTRYKRQAKRRLGAIGPLITDEERKAWLDRQAAFKDALAGEAIATNSDGSTALNAPVAPVARGVSDAPEAHATDVGARSTEEALKSQGGTYDLARLVAEDDAIVAIMPFPRTNVSPQRDPLPEVPEWEVEDLDWRPSGLRDLYYDEAIKRIVGWYKQMAEHEASGIAKGGSGVRRPDDVVLDDEHLRPKARGRPWYLSDHIRSGGTLPIVPLEEAVVTPPALHGERIRRLGVDYHDEAVLDHLTRGHSNESTCPRVTVLSANHAGALRNSESIAKTFAEDSAPDRGWLMGCMRDDTEKPLVLRIDGEDFTVPVFVATCPARVEPVNGVEQNGKVRVTTDKAWPRPEVLLPLGPLAANFWMDLEALGKVVFPTTVQFAAGCAVLLQAEPEETRRLPTAPERAAAAESSPEEHCWEWKIDLHSAYRFWANAKHELWMYGKQWAGQSYLDVRTQFGDASMVACFASFTNFFLWLLRRLRAGDERLREELGAPAELWAAIDAAPPPAAVAWRERREAAGLCGEDVQLSHESGYIDDIFGVALGRARTKAILDVAVLLSEHIGFVVQTKKKDGPKRSMTILGSRCDLDMMRLSLDEEKARSYLETLNECIDKRSMRTRDFLSLVCRLVHASQYRPAGRPYLTSAFTALRQAERRGRQRVRIGRGVRRDLEFWQCALLKRNDGVALFPRNRFPPSGDPGLLEYAYDASGGDGLGAAMLQDGPDGTRTCYYILHRWRGNHRRLHINVKEGIAGHAALTGLYPVAPRPAALAHGDNTTEQYTSAANKARSVLQSVVLQHSAEFVAKVNVVRRQARVRSKDNVLSDAISRLNEHDFRTEARKLGATRFVRLPLSAETHALLDDLDARLAQLEADGEDTSGTAASVDEMREREALYDKIEKEREERKIAAEAVELPAGDDVDDDAPAWGFLSGFCGLDSMSFAAEPLGGQPLGAFDCDDIVRYLWDSRTGLESWGDFYDVVAAADLGELDWMKPLLLIYISGSPCPDFSSAGLGRGLDGSTGGLWLDDCKLGISLRPPVLVREMVTGILDIDNGSPLWDAVSMYRRAGYIVSWSIRSAMRHGDGTSRRRVFLVAILPEVLIEGTELSHFFTVEGPRRDRVTVLDCLDPTPPEGCEYTAWEKHVTWFADRVPDPSYDGPKLVGAIGVGGMGWSVYDADGPGVTQKTWGQGPGGATGLYWDGATVRRLSPWEALRLHSIPESVITCLRNIPDDVVDDTAAYRLCGNGIPVGMLADVISQILVIIKPQVRSRISTALAAWQQSHGEAPSI